MPAIQRRVTARSEDTTVVFLLGADRVPPRTAPARPGRRAETPQAPVVEAPAQDTVAAPVTPPARPGFGPFAPGPAVGDGRLWVSPRPGLPVVVADQLYGTAATPEQRDSVAFARLRAMVDTLNHLIDEDQRAARLPDWTWGDDDAKWGIDQQWIHLGGIKIPTMALALLGAYLPQGSYDQAQRARQLADMRTDLLYSAWRAQNYQDFRRYVQETRERREKEREAERAKRDSSKVVQ